MSTSEALTRIKTRTPWKQRVATTILQAHRRSATLDTTSHSKPIRIVCISDTHNKHPTVPLGDVLIHAGDLTENGSFDEVQKELDWLSSLPHKHKILVAGNHDVLLDDAFLSKYPERRYGQTKTRHDLNWGEVTYLQDTSITLEINIPSEISSIDQQTDDVRDTRKITIFGSPWTPQYGTSAFQYRPDEGYHWENILSSLGTTTPDIIVTHGPPRLHLDGRDFHRAGCPYLAEEIRLLRPRLHVFGHIHVSYGQEDVILDGVQGGHEKIMTGWAGWGTVVYMVMLAACARIMRALKFGDNKTTTFVNAAVVSGPNNDLSNEPIIFDI